MTLREFSVCQVKHTVLEVNPFSLLSHKSITSGSVALRLLAAVVTETRGTFVSSTGCVPEGTAARPHTDRQKGCKLLWAFLKCKHFHRGNQALSPPTTHTCHMHAISLSPSHTQTHDQLQPQTRADTHPTTDTRRQTLDHKHTCGYTHSRTLTHTQSLNAQL